MNKPLQDVLGRAARTQATGYVFAFPPPHDGGEFAMLTLVDGKVVAAEDSNDAGPEVLWTLIARDSGRVVLSETTVDTDSIHAAIEDDARTTWETALDLDSELLALAPEDEPPADDGDGPRTHPLGVREQAEAEALLAALEASSWETRDDIAPGRALDAAEPAHDRPAPVGAADTIATDHSSAVRSPLETATREVVRSLLGPQAMAEVDAAARLHPPPERPRAFLDTVRELVGRFYDASLLERRFDHLYREVDATDSDDTAVVAIAAATIESLLGARAAEQVHRVAREHPPSAEPEAFLTAARALAAGLYSDSAVRIAFAPVERSLSTTRRARHA
ncbi:MAG: hypothetical protein H6983_00405 [Ectothiorhodospiraceae bacterium]|nr:hypothetical protein [Ectothiorhodospiraceae bacterium]